MTRWLVTGSAGMLGRDLMACLRGRQVTVLGLRRAELDVTDARHVLAVIRDYNPDIVVNCAGWTAVDAAETDEACARAANGAGAGHIASACAETGALMAHISTDYVFDGLAREPYAEDADPAPRTAYGRSKLAGERAVRALLPDRGLIVRTSWLYGGQGPSFVHTMIGLAATSRAVDVVADQRGQPTWTLDVADQVVALAVAGRLGIYHATSSGDATWFELAREVFALAGADPDRVRPVSSEAFPRPAPRPAYSVLGHDRHRAIGLQPIGDWRAALRRAWPAIAGPPDS
jgi:dTDP-4-dehydrorhamnose reductase